MDVDKLHLHKLTRPLEMVVFNNMPERLNKNVCVDICIYLFLPKKNNFFMQKKKKSYANLKKHNIKIWKCITLLKKGDTFAIEMSGENGQLSWINHIFLLQNVQINKLY